MTEKKITIAVVHNYGVGSKQDRIIMDTLPHEYFCGAGSFIGAKERDMDWIIPISKASAMIKLLKKLPYKLKISIHDAKYNKLKFTDLP